MLTSWRLCLRVTIARKENDLQQLGLISLLLLIACLRVSSWIVLSEVGKKNLHMQDNKNGLGSALGE